MKQKKSIIWGTILVIVGLIYLINNLDIWNINLFFEGWWTLFIIIPSLISLINKNNIISSILGIIIGVLLLLATRNYIAWIMVGKIFLPLIIIIIGISLIFKSKIYFRKKDNKNNPEYFGIFAGCEEKITDTFKGGSCIAVFGGVELDLSDAKITDDITIDCIAIFGGVDIKLPKNVILKSEGISIFGGATNKYIPGEKLKSPTIYINHVSIFGGTEIK
ncbi:MAG: hypothetical protein PHD03_03500 [Bacilli bacterium]|nr:hypothetical protein [Bacilli bacterium]MDD4407019.1 hypothetical protein [Bacilli bacterium]